MLKNMLSKQKPTVLHSSVGSRVAPIKVKLCKSKGYAIVCGAHLSIFQIFTL